MIEKERTHDTFRMVPTPLYPTQLAPSSIKLDDRALYRHSNNNLKNTRVTVTTNESAYLTIARLFKGYHGIIRDYRNGIAEVELFAAMSHRQNVVKRIPLENLVHYG